MKKVLSVLMVLTMLLVPFAYAEDAAAIIPSARSTSSFPTTRAELPI